MKKFLHVIVILLLLFTIVMPRAWGQQYIYTNGQTTTPIPLPGNSCVYKWTNSNPGIGLPASGKSNGAIPAFNAINTGTTDQTATINLSLTTDLYNYPAVYLVAQLSGKVWMINPATNTAYSAVQAGSEPFGIAISPDRLTAYVTNKTSGTVSVIRTIIIITPPPPPPSLNFIKVTDIPVGAKPEGIVISPDGKKVYVVNSEDASVTVINTDDNTVISTIPLSTLHPSGIAITPDGSKLYISNYASGTVSVITTSDNKIKTIIPVGVNPEGITVSPDGSNVYVANQGSNTVSVINTSTDALFGTPIAVGSQPFGIAISPDGKTVYTSNQGDNSVSVINTANKQVAKITVGNNPHGISVTPDGTKLYVNNTGSDEISVIDISNNNSISTFSQDSGPFSFGNFIAQPSGCTIPPFTITITVKPTPSAISYTGAPSAVNTSYGVASAATSFNVSGLSLTQGVLVTPPSGFEVSLDGDTFSPTVTVGTGGNLVSTQVYIRLAKTTAQGTHSGNISLSSPGANPVTVAMPVSTVRPPEPTILTGKVSGDIYACAGQPSASPNLQQFTVSAINLNGVLGATAPTGFEISLSASSGFASHIDISNDTNVPETTIYVRASAAITAGTTNGNITFTAGPLSQKVAVSAVAFKVPVASPPTPATQTVINQKASTAIHFTGTGNTFIWKNDHPEINLPESGTGDIASFTAVNNTSADITATITAWPVSLPLSYITNFANNSLSVVSINSGELIANIPNLGAGPKGVVVSKDATRLYVANYASNDVNVIDATTNTVIATVKVGVQPQGITLSADGSTVSVYNSSENTVSVISTATNQVIATKNADAFPPGTIFSPDGKIAYVYDYMVSVFFVVNVKTQQTITSLPGSTSPQGLVQTAEGKILYNTSQGQNKVYVIDGTTFRTIQTIDVGVYPQGLALSHDEKWLYVANAQQNTISVINTATYEVEKTVNVGNFPAAIGTTAGTGCEGLPVTCTIIVKPTPPTITVKGSPLAQNTIQGNPSTPPSTFTVSGIKMQEGILVTPPAGFEVSLDGITFSTTVTIPLGANGIIPETTVYIRVAASTPVGKYSGDIIFTSKNADPKTLPMPECEVYLPTSSILAGLASGSINTCEGAPSASPNIIQFTASGFLLVDDIKATAPKGFELSLDANTGYASSIILRQSGGSVSPTVVYVRSDAAAKGSIFGDVTLTTPGATNRSVFVKANVGITPTVAQVANQAPITGGMSTLPVNFTGSANTYFSWTNDNTSIGLAQSGFGDIAAFTAINKGNTQQVATITVTPLTAPLAYVPMFNNNRLAIINTATNTVVGSQLTIGLAPYAVAASPDGKFVYIANQGENNISVINTSTNKEVLPRIAVGRGPSGIIVSNDGGKIYVANGSENTVSVIDAGTYLSTKLQVGVSPDGIALSPDGKALYVVNRNSSFVSVINTSDQTSIKIPTSGLSPEGIAISPDGTTVYITNYNSRSVTVIDANTNTVKTSIAVGVNPRGIAINNNGSKVYVANAGSKSVSIIDTKTNTVTSINVGTNPQGVSISPDGSLVYVANSGSNNISVINAATNVVTTIDNIGGSPVSFGNFITGGAGCSGKEIKFTITVNPESAYMLATGTLPSLSTTYGTPSSAGLFTVSGISLSGNITVSPPPGIELSTDNITFKPSLSLTKDASGNVGPIDIWVRLSKTAVTGPHTGAITLSSTGAGTVPVPLTAPTVVDSALLTITAKNVTKTVNTTLTGGPGSTAFLSPVGLQNGESIGTVTITYGPGAESSAVTGTYKGSVLVSHATGGTFSASNYSIRYLAGDIIVSNVIDANLITIPNAFTPNGDGINDTWKIDYLLNFPNCTVNIYDRSGRNLFHSVGYSTPWTGTFAGQPLPFGTYYYVIDINNGAKRLSGFVLLMK